MKDSINTAPAEAYLTGQRTMLESLLAQQPDGFSVARWEIEGRKKTLTDALDGLIEGSTTFAANTLIRAVEDDMMQLRGKNVSAVLEDAEAALHALSELGYQEASSGLRRSLGESISRRHVA